MHIQLSWGTCTGTPWCPFQTVDLTHPIFSTLGGVYMIWFNGQGNNPGQVVRVGQGLIRDRIAVHRLDLKVTAYANRGLFVTWAQVDQTYRNGVELYLAQTWQPIVGDRFPDVQPITVNSPF